MRSMVEGRAHVPGADGNPAEGIVITRDGKPAGVLIGFASEDDWFDYNLGSDPRFLTRIEQAHASLRAGHGVKLEDIEEP